MISMSIIQSLQKTLTGYLSLEACRFCSILRFLFSEQEDQVLGTLNWVCSEAPQHLVCLCLVHASNQPLSIGTRSRSGSARQWIQQAVDAFQRFDQPSEASEATCNQHSCTSKPLEKGPERSNGLTS